MNWDKIEHVLERWFLRATGVTSVIWAEDKAPLVDRPYGELRLRTSRGVGTDEIRREVDATQSLGKELVRTVSGHRILTLVCKVRSRDNRPSRAAMPYLERARTSLAKLSTIGLFQTAELAIIGAEPLVELPGLFQGRMESLASMDVLLSSVVNETDPREQGGYIDKVEYTSIFRNVDGEPLPDSLQLDEEEMP